MRYLLASFEKKLYGQVQNLKYIKNYIDVVFWEKVYDYMYLVEWRCETDRVDEKGEVGKGGGRRRGGREIEGLEWYI